MDPTRRSEEGKGKKQLLVLCKPQIFNLVMKFVYVLCVFCVMYGIFNAINDFDSSSGPLVQRSV